MYLTRFFFLFWLPSVFSTTNYTVDGEEPHDVPRFFKDTKGRKHCYMNPYLFCPEGKKCCTHVHQRKIWCCDKKDKCGSSPKTCVIG